MSFCTYSIDQIAKQSISIDNVFLNEFLPILPDHAVKVYIYGLYHCSNPVNADNTLADFSRILNLSEEDIVSEYEYLQELGLVQLINVTPLRVKYLPVNKASLTLKKYNIDKYSSFNKQAQELITGRIITPSEYNQYYYVIESLHIETDAFVKIIKYCVDIKGNKVGHSYITTVAKNWAYEGITTSEKVEERLRTQQAIDSDVGLVLKAAGIKRAASAADFERFLAWTNEMGMELPVLIYLATLSKNKGGFDRLDYLVNKFYKLRLTSQKEIEEYLQQENYLFTVAKQVSRNLGVRYENLEIVVETYVNNWVTQGYDLETLLLLSKHAFLTGVRTLSGFAAVVNKFYKLGLVTQESINAHLENTLQLDKKIKQLLEKLGIIRQVNQNDRNYYNTWLIEWQTGQEVLDYAVALSADKIQPLTFLNKILSIYFQKGIKTAQDAQKESANFANNAYIKSDKAPAKNKKATKHEYSKEELSSLFSSVEEVLL